MQIFFILFFKYTLFKKKSIVLLAYVVFYSYLCHMFIKEYKIGDQVARIYYKDEQAYLDEVKTFKEFEQSEMHQQHIKELWYGKI